MQLYTGLEVGIEGATDAVGQRSLDRLRVRRGEEEARRTEEEESVDVEAGEERLMVVTESTAKDAVERPEAALETEGNGKGEGEGYEGGDGTLRALGAI